MSENLRIRTRNNHDLRVWLLFLSVIGKFSFLIICELLKVSSLCLVSENDPSESYISLCFRKLSSGAPNGNFRENICSEDDLRSRILQQMFRKF